TLHTTPGDCKLRSMTASLRNQIAYTNQEQFAVQAKMPRPLSEMSQTFPMISVKPGITDPIVRRLYLAVDQDLARASLESALISIKTILRLQIVLDNSETPNINLEIPIVIIPANLEGYAAPGSNVASSSASMYTVTTSPLMRATNPTPSIRSADNDSFLNILSSPVHRPQPETVTSTMNGSISSIPNPSHPPSSTRYPFNAPNVPVYDVPSMARSPSRATLDSQQAILINRTTQDPRATPNSILQQQQQQYHQYQQFSSQQKQYPQQPKQQEPYPYLDAREEKRRLEAANSATAPNSAPAYSAPVPTPVIPTNQPIYTLPGNLNGSIRSMSQRGGFNSTRAMTDVASDRTSMRSGRSAGADWSYERVGEWARSLGASQEIVQSFIDNQIDGSILPTLTQEDLRELGVSQLGLRKKMLAACERM
ncbi:UNVERIFIED_CONTAM: hypothetical protein HDU68_002356, partial [Siphonaria sp. JEL0065]